MSHDEIREKLSKLVSTLYVGRGWAFILDIFDTHIIVALDISTDSGYETKYFRLAYEIGDDDTASLGEPEEVERQVQYIAIESELRILSHKLSAITPVVESEVVHFSDWIAEATTDDIEEFDVWRSVIIQEGTSKNGWHYTAEVLAEAAKQGVFNGVPILDWEEEKHVTARGGYQHVCGWISETTFGTLDGSTGLIGLAHISKRRDYTAAIREANKEGLQPGLSIRATLEATIADLGGEEGLVRKVTEFTSGRSVDLVFNPSAGGRLVEPLSESSNQGGQSLMNLQQKLDWLRQHAPNRVAALGTDNIEEAAVDAAIAEAMVAGDVPVAEAVPASVPTSTPAPTVTVEAFEKLQAEIAESNARESLRRDLDSRTLDPTVRARVETSLGSAISLGTELTTESIGAAVKAELDYLGQFTQRTAGQGLGFGQGVFESGLDHLEKKLIGLERIFFMDDPESANIPIVDAPASEAKIDWKGIPAYRSLKQAYADLTGHTVEEGLAFGVQGTWPILGDPQMGEVAEGMATSSFALLLANALTKRMQREYSRPESNNWRNLVKVVPVSDLKTQNRIRLGGFGNLPGVDEGAEYTDLGVLAENQATYTPSKYGGLADITEETLINDDLARLRDIPVKLAVAAQNSINDFIETFITGNGTVADDIALFDSGTHNNLGSTALSAASLTAGRLAMMKQTETVSTTGEGSTTRNLHIRPRFLLIPPDLESTAYDLLLAASGLTNDVPNFVQSLKLQAYTMLTATDTNNWYLVADPRRYDTIEIGFLNGKDRPEVFVQNGPTEGKNFSNDQVTFKVKWYWGGAVIDYKPFYGAIVT